MGISSRRHCQDGSCAPFMVTDVNAVVGPPSNNG
jgi:hypothetical protein